MNIKVFTVSNTIYLFDIEGTLIDPEKDNGTLSIDQDLAKYLTLMKNEGYTLGIVSSSYMESIRNKLGPHIESFAYVFPENGVIAYINGELKHQKNITECVPKKTLDELVDFSLQYIEKLDLPVKTDTFIQYRTALINISPCGRSVNLDQRQQFKSFDKQHDVIKTFQKDLSEKFEKDGLNFAVGGEISLECYPKGWDKTFCLQFLSDFDEIHFFGDKTYKGGNDYEIYNHRRVTGHAVNSVEDTKKIIKKLISEQHKNRHDDLNIRNGD